MALLIAEITARPSHAVFKHVGLRCQHHAHMLGFLINVPLVDQMSVFEGPGQLRPRGPMWALAQGPIWLYKTGLYGPGTLQSLNSPVRFYEKTSVEALNLNGTADFYF